MVVSKLLLTFIISKETRTITNEIKYYTMKGLTTQMILEAAFIGKFVIASEYIKSFEDVAPVTIYKAGTLNYSYSNNEGKNTQKLVKHFYDEIVKVDFSMRTLESEYGFDYSVPQFILETSKGLRINLEDYLQDPDEDYNRPIDFRIYDNKTKIN